MATAPSVPSAPADSRSPGAAAAPPERAVWVEIVHDANGLAPHLAAWDDLAAAAVEPNAFDESWLLLPALNAFGAGHDLVFVLVYRKSAKPHGAPTLCGLFPLERRRRCKGIPVRVLRLWQHVYGYLGTPLVRAGCERETLAAFLDWAATDPAGASIIELPMIHGEGPFAQALLDVLNDRHLLAVTDEAYTRAFIRRGADAEAYCAAHSSGSRKEWRRLRKRLSELGALELRVLNEGEEAGPWIERFLALEASGWKGEQKTALAVGAPDRAFFTAAALGAHARGQLHMLGLFLDGRPVALKCNFIAGAGAFTFKIAFDEAHAKLSPGVLLELDNIAELHRHPRLRWMDSCAVPRHFMINRLWQERRTIQSLLIATGRWTGNLVVGLLPLVRAARAALRGRVPTST